LEPDVQGQQRRLRTRQVDASERFAVEQNCCSEFSLQTREGVEAPPCARYVEAESPPPDVAHKDILAQACTWRKGRQDLIRHRCDRQPSLRGVQGIVDRFP